MNPRFIHLYKNIYCFIGGGRERLGRFNSFLIYAALLILTLLLFQPTLAKEAPALNAPSLVNQAFTNSDLPIIKSHLYALQQQTVELEKFSGWGGAIEPLGDKLLLVTTKGRIALIQPDGEVVYLKERIPMSQSALESSGLTDKALSLFRVADILLHEQLPDKLRLFVSHHYFVEDCIEFRISSALLHLDTEQAMTFDPWKTEFIAKPCIPLLDDFPGQRAGGRMLMDGAEHLLVVIGAHGWKDGWWGVDVSYESSDLHLGKLVRIHLTSGNVEILASGLRNSQGFARDEDGTLWAADHGPRGGDELNILRPGLHYGWHYVTYGTQYENKIWRYNEVQGRHDGFEMPVFAWVPSIAPSSIIVSDSQLFPLWQNDLLIASLRAESIFRVRLQEKRVVYVERIEIGSRIRDMTQMSDGRIALLFDDAKILFLQRAPVYCQDESSIYSHDAHDVCIDIFRIIEEAGDPIIRSNYDVYIHESRLLYVKGSPCSEDDIEHRFFLHITPVHVNDLPEERKQYGFDNLNFLYNDYGVSMRENCIVMRDLPQYDIKHIATGQTMRVESPSGEVSWTPVWKDERDVYIDIFRIIEEAGDPIIRSNYDVYIHESRLLYVKGSPCSEDDIEHRFFLHITPVHVNDLPEERKQYGFDNLNFLYNDYGVSMRENCIVMRDLPQYDIKHIATGQTMRVESSSGEVSWAPVWKDEHDVYIDIFRIIEEAGDPIIRSNYDVYIHESRLLYVKSPCSEDDIEHRFFLHITPVHMNDLPEERKQHGFDNLDFPYSDYGVPVGENCIVMRDLPQYDIKHIATGQTMRVESPSGEVSWPPVWRGEHDVIDIFRIIEEAGDPIIRSNEYDVYIHESRLLYVKSPCSEDDIEHRFFLQITPVHVNDLPEERKQYGFDNLDFLYNDYDVSVGENCIVMRDLPQYDIKHIATGQTIGVESLSGEVSWPPSMQTDDR